MVRGGLLFRFFLFFLASAEVAAGPLAIAVLTALDAFSLGIAFSARLSSWGMAAASVIGSSIWGERLDFGEEGASSLSSSVPFAIQDLFEFTL